MSKYFKYFFLVIFAVSLNGSYAADQPEKKNDKLMTRAEVVEKISTTDFFKKKIGDLLNWSIGYDITKINRLNG